jgi:hypothetical protein
MLYTFYRITITDIRLSTGLIDNDKRPRIWLLRVAYNVSREFVHLAKYSFQD